jgi:hypothetical protein
MKTRNLLTIALAIVMLAAPLGIIQSARAQGRDVYASEVTFDPVLADSKPVEYKLPSLISMEKGGNFTYKNETYTIKPNDGAVYGKGDKAVGRVTETKYYTEPAETEELVVDLYIYDSVAGKSYNGKEIVYAFRVQFNAKAPYVGEQKYIDEPFKVDPEGLPLADTTFTVEGEEYSVKKGNTTVYGANDTVVGKLKVGYRARSGDLVDPAVTLKSTGESVDGAQVRWVGDPQTTNSFGECEFEAPFVESYKYYGPVEASKEYGSNETVKRSVYGSSKFGIYVVPYDLSNPEEFLAWWSHFALTEEAQAMYTAAEVLGEWGANLSDDVTVWNNIFGAKGGSLAKFIKGFPQFMVDRGAAIEATKNMLDTIWALFTLLPAFVLATPQLLQTMPMRMLQFWPVLFINLDKVLNGVSDMVIDLGVFMTSLAPSVLLLLPEIFNRLPEIGPNAMNIVLTSFELFVQMIPALSQYLPAAIAAIPAFYIQMLMALFFNAPAIISTAMSESFDTITKLFRSWPLFPAGIAAGILAVAPAMMMLPSMAPLRLAGRTLENTVGALSTWMQQLRAAPSQLLDPILYAFGTNPATLVVRYLMVFGYCGITSAMLCLPITIAKFALSVALLPLSILAAILLSVPAWAMMLVLPVPVPVLLWIDTGVKLTVSCITGLFGIVSCTPTEWVSCTAFLGALFELTCSIVAFPCLCLVPSQLLWAGWMALSTIAAFVVEVPSAIGDMISEVAKRCTQICTIPGYAVGWCFQGVLDILQLGCVKSVLDMTKEISAEIPEIMKYIGPIVEQIVQVLVKMFPELINQFLQAGGISGEAMAKICGGLVIEAVKPL